jgi:hypothetical protein
VADPLTPDQIRHIEDNTEVKAVAHEWDLSPEQIENMKSLGLWDEDEDDDEPGSEFIAYQK